MPACCHRQPNGWAGEIERFLDLVSHVRYTRLSKSPFIFFSCAPVHVHDGLGDFMRNLVGTRMLTKITDLWGEWVPFIVLLNAILGGGDLDDLMMIYIYDRLVNFLRSPEELLFVAAYPNEKIVLDANVIVANVAPTSHQATYVSVSPLSWQRMLTHTSFLQARELIPGRQMYGI